MRRNIEKCVVLSVAAVFISTFFYKQKVDVSASYGRIFYKLGMECEGKCPSGQQIKYFKRSVHYNPNLSSSYYQLAVLYEKKGEYQKALDFYKIVTRLDHTHNTAYFKVGLDHFQKGELEYALRYFLQAFKHKDVYHEFHKTVFYYYLGRVYELRKDYGEAIKAYREAVEGGYKQVYGLTKMGMLYHRLGDKVMALKQIEQLRELREDRAADRLEHDIETGSDLDAMIDE
jgi:tetratricopeptide (TPR) repeat protein